MRGKCIDKLNSVKWKLYYKINLLKLKYIGDNKQFIYKNYVRIKIKEGEVDQGIDKFIWSYWNTSELPSDIVNFINSNRRINPNFKYIIVNDYNLQEYLNDFPKDIKFPSVQHKADLIRLLLLNKYGGIWIDITTILTKSLDWVIALQQNHKTEFVGYYNPHMMRDNDSLPMIENWFMAAPKNSKFIKIWLNEFLEALKSESPRDYYQKHHDFEDIRQNINPPFDRTFTMHLSAQKILQHNQFSYYLINAEDDGLYFNYCSKNRVEYCSNLLLRGFSNLPSVIKITGGDRIKLNDFINKKVFSKKSIFYTYKIINNY